MNMKRLTLIIAAVFLAISLLASKVNRIDPPTWWTGFNNKELQLMVYGDDISLLTPEIDYPGVSIHAITRAQSPNYLFIDLKLGANIQPGAFDIIFKNGKKTVATYNYILNPRSEGSASRTGFDNSDVLYLLFPDRFANGNPNNDNIAGMPDKVNREYQYGRRGGDIQGMINKLDYLQELGVTAIWTTPLLEDNRPHASYHHYATTDYYRIDPRFGTNDEYRSMVAECHSRGIKVVMDMIPNHCGYTHPWMSDLPFEDWINGGTEYTQTNYRIPVTNDPYVSDIDWDLNFNGWFVSEMPDLNQNNPFMLRYLKQMAVWWVEFAGLDGIRVDTYPYNDQWRAAEWTKHILSEFPYLNIVGECWVSGPSETAYWQSGTINHNGYDSGLPSLMDFPLYDATGAAFNEDEQGWDRGVGQLWKTLTQDFLYGDPYNLVIFLENHDTQRFFTQVGKDIDKLKMGYAFLLTTRGIPQIYYGTEILMAGDKGVGDGDIRREMPGGWPDHERSVFTYGERSGAENDAFGYISKLIHWRNENPVIHYGSLLHFVPENNVYVYFRQNDEKTIMVILNNNPAEQTLNTERFDQVLRSFSSGTDVVSEQLFNLKSPLKLEGKTAYILELQ
jgi:glycosidase